MDGGGRSRSVAADWGGRSILTGRRTATFACRLCKGESRLDRRGRGLQRYRSGREQRGWLVVRFNLDDRIGRASAGGQQSGAARESAFVRRGH